MCAQGLGGRFTFIMIKFSDMDPFDTMMVALRFNEMINQRDLEGLLKLMTSDHTFVVYGSTHTTPMQRHRQ